MDILPYLLLPLAGPEEFSESEMDGLPLELQYLEETKEREGDIEIRKMLVEALTLVGIWGGKKREKTTKADRKKEWLEEGKI